MSPPTAVICGHVIVEADCRVMFGAVVVAEAAPITIGCRSIIMGNAVVRSWPGLPVTIGNDVMSGPQAVVNRAEDAHNVFLATRATIFPGAVLVLAQGPDSAMTFGLHGVNFTRAVFGEGRQDVGMKNYGEMLEAHFGDCVLDETNRPRRVR
jgi:hypothetical protein